MNWHKIFFWRKNKPINNKLDHKLIKRIKPGFLPNWRQLRYLDNFLSKWEKRTIYLTLLATVLATVTWITIFFIKNQTLVPAIGGEYNEALIGQPKFINPLFASINDIDDDLTYLVYSGLFRYNEKQILEPDLATEYSISKDKKIYTVKLRPDVKWSDGESFTANDIIFTFNTIQNSAVNSPLFATFQSVKVEKEGDFSVRFTLKEPFVPFLNSLTVGILPQHIWRDIQPVNIKLAKTNLQPIGTGAWKFSKLTKDETGNIKTYVLVPNKYYYGKSPYLKSIIFKFYPDYTQGFNALKSQTVTGLGFVPADLKSKISTNNFNIYKLNLPQYTALFFNQDKEASLKENDLRLALLQSIDKNKIIAEALDNEGIITESPILKNYSGFSANLKYPNFDINSANKLLDKKWSKIQPEQYFDSQYNILLKEKETELNNIKKNTSTPQETVSSSIAQIEKELKETVRNKMSSNQSFYRQDKDKNILELTITTVNTVEFRKVAEAVGKMWQTVGVQTNIKYISKLQIIELLKNRDYQILLYGEIMGNDPDPFPFWHSSQTNYPGLNLALFSDRDTDKILEQARSNVSDQERVKLYGQFQKILLDEIPAIFLYTPTHNMIINNGIKGIKTEQIFYPFERFVNINDWYIKSKRQWK